MTNPTNPNSVILLREAKEKLRLQAEAEVHLQTNLASHKPQAEVDARYLLHELEVHQIELKMQNEELCAARAELEAGLERYTDLFEFAPVGYLNLNDQGEIQLVNLTGAKLVGIERAQLMGRRFGMFVARSDRRVFTDCFARVFATQTPQTCEVELVSKERPPRFVRLDVMLSPDGKDCRVVVMDITERKRAEEALLLVNSAVLQARDSILITDAQLDLPGPKIVFVNPAFTSMTGYTAEEVIGKTPRILQGPKTDKALLLRLRQNLERGEVFTGQSINYRKDGKEFILDWHIAPIRNTSGTITHFVAIQRDVTAQNSLEAQLRQSQKMECIGTLAGGIAHDLNNVLTPIMMSIDLLKMKEKDERDLNILSVIEDSAKRGADMVLQVLSFARGVEGQQLEVQVWRLLNEVKKIIQDTFPKNIEVRSKLPADLWLVRGDPTQLHQVLLNLCINARDAMPDGGTVTIAANNLTLDEQYAGMNIDAKSGPHVCIEVEDSGSGMTPEVIDRIFEPFFTTKELDKGTGLGLSTSIAIIKSHGGFVRVYSEVGMGSRFHVYLPAHTGPSGEEKATAPVELLHGKGELVLVVDDEPAVRQIIAQTLETFGYRVVLASDGVEATSIYATRKEEISVVITDMMMPLMDGPKTIQVLRKMNPQVRIIAASGLNANAMVAKATSAGVKHFIPKPYTAETLLKTLRAVLEV